MFEFEIVCIAFGCAYSPTSFLGETARAVRAEAKLIASRIERNRNLQLTAASMRLSRIWLEVFLGG
jgi:hypothetical protein